MSHVSDAERGFSRPLGSISRVDGPGGVGPDAGTLSNLPEYWTRGSGGGGGVGAGQQQQQHSRHLPRAGNESSALQHLPRPPVVEAVPPGQGQHTGVTPVHGSPVFQSGPAGGGAGYYAGVASRARGGGVGGDRGDGPSDRLGPPGVGNSVDGGAGGSGNITGGREREPPGGWGKSNNGGPKDLYRHESGAYRGREAMMEGGRRGGQGSPPPPSPTAGSDGGAGRVGPDAVGGLGRAGHGPGPGSGPGSGPVSPGRGNEESSVYPPFSRGVGDGGGGVSGGVRVGRGQGDASPSQGGR